MTVEPPDSSRMTPSEEEASALSRLFPLFAEMDPRDRWLELGSAFLLAVAVVATAWSGYQATRWGGKMSVAFTAAGSERLESIRASNRAGRLVQIDVALFVAFLQATSQEDTPLAEFLFGVMRTEFLPALEEWIAMREEESPDTPRTPFELVSYQLADAQVAEDLVLNAELLSEEGRDANQNVDDYVLGTVLFAAVLFFGGVGTKFKSRLVKLVTLFLGLGLFVFGVVLVATYPIA